uniref:Secreted protein n=1 Tax=Steinernema glaseri TaxID=37863 RepID=A0A1I7YVW1_9BILA
MLCPVLLLLWITRSYQTSNVQRLQNRLGTSDDDTLCSSSKITNSRDEHDLGQKGSAGHVALQPTAADDYVLAGVAPRQSADFQRFR